MYDVLIIGAGPAGSTAAKRLAENGFQVLLIEKFKMPRYKSCSGVLIQKSLNLVKLYFGEEIPAFTMCAPEENKGMVFTDDKGREYRFEQGGLNVWRGFFDHWLAEKAMESGVEVRDCTAVLDCKEQAGCVCVTLRGEKTYTEKARYVLDCEGIAGLLKRKIAGGGRDYITTFQTFNKGSIELDSHFFYAYLQPALSEYDAWFNVKDHLLVLGVSVKDPCKIADYYDRFLSYLRQSHNLLIEEQIKSEKWLMPRIRPGCRIDYGVGRMLFAGEIAGFLNPMGEGISAALESGWQAANAIAAHFDNLHEIYRDYQGGTAALRAYMERQWNFVGGIAGTFSEMKVSNKG